MRCGFSSIDDWPSVYWHVAFRVLLLVYVDDFKMAGPPSAVSLAWQLTRQELLIGEPGPVSVFLGCTQREHSVSDAATDAKHRALEYDLEEFLRSCLDLFEDLTGDKVHRTSPTLYLP